MSACACVVFYGLRFDVPPDEVEALERQSDPRLLAARRAGLKHYWANFGSPGERYLLFVGAHLGVLGQENSPEVIFREAEIEGILKATKTKLELSKLSGEPTLYIQWLPDV